VDAVAQSPESLPAAIGQCVTTLKPAQGGVDPQQTATKVYRSIDGRTRFDSGTTSVITDPAKQQTIILDHLKKEASIIPMMPTPPAAPQVPGGLPAEPPGAQRLVNMQSLGKSIIEGHEVEGMRYTFQPPDAPKMPSVPQPPAIPGVKPPQPPPSPLTTAEVWTSTKLKLPVLTKTTGSFGEEIRRCRYAEAAEPPPNTFQIPPDYKQTVLTGAAPPPPPAPDVGGQKS
jgi:hypothetical protein